MIAMVITRFVAILYQVSPHFVFLHVIRRVEREKGATVPTSHAPERLDAPIDISLALEQEVRGMLDGLALAVQVGQGAGADGLGLVGEGLAGLEALGAAVQAVGAGEELLALLEGGVRGVVAVAGAEEGGAVVGQAAEFAAVGVHVRVPVAETLVDLGAGRGRDVLLF